MNSYLTAAWPFGVAGGVLLGICFALMYFLGAEPVGMMLIFGYVTTPVFVFAGIKQFRDRQNGGELFFGQGMTVGFFVYTIMAVLSALCVALFMLAVPEVFEIFKASNLALLESKRELLTEQIGEASYVETVRNIEAMSFFDVVLNDFLRKIIPGLFFTIIISIILKRTLSK